VLNDYFSLCFWSALWPEALIVPASLL